MLRALIIAAVFYYILEKYTSLNPATFMLLIASLVAPYSLYVIIKSSIDEYRERQETTKII